MADTRPIRLVGEKDVVAALDGMAKQSSRNRVARPAIRAGASDYVVKPFEDDRVLSAVKMVLSEES